MELFAKIVNGRIPLFIFAKTSILDLWLSFQYATEQDHFVVHIVCFIGPGYYNNSKFKNWSNLLSSSNGLRSYYSVSGKY